MNDGISVFDKSWECITPPKRTVLEDIALQYFYTSTGKKAVAYLDFYEQGWFIPPAYDGGQQFSFKKAEEPLTKQFSVNVYPNPGSVMINFDITNYMSVNDDMQLDIFDASGRMVHAQTIKDYESIITLQTDLWVNGHYTYRLHSNSELLNSGSFEIVK
ncbi:MAG: T9SS type A sorting domain-containing protein [Flavobacteriales bacterium]